MGTSFIGFIYDITFVGNTEIKKFRKDKNE